MTISLKTTASRLSLAAAVLALSAGLNQQWLANVFAHLLRLPPAYFEKRHLGDVVSRFDAIDTIRKTQTWYANAYDAGKKFSCETVVGLDQKKQYVSMGHTFGKWFSCFMQGARLRMGMVRRQNEALALQRLEMEDAVCFMLIAFGAGL